MIGENWPGINVILGLGEEALMLWQMGIRTFVVYLAAIILVRLGKKRFLGKCAALDVILGFALGSILSSAIHSQRTGVCANACILHPKGAVGI